MTLPKIDFTGVTVQSLQEVIDELVDGFKGIYGSDIDLSQNTPDGQRLGILAKISADLQAYGLALFHIMDPDLAYGEMLNKIIKIAGITRNPATRSNVAMQITTDRAMTLPSGYIVKDSDNHQWLTTGDVVLVLGVNSDITFHAEFFGNYEAPASTIIESVSVELGVLSIINPLDAVAGLDEETDEELRVRRNKSLQNASYSTVGGLFAKLVDLDGVVDLQVYENDTHLYDAVKDMVSHSIWVVIEGGDSDDIVETMAKSKTSGTSKKGSESGIYEESLLEPDGSTRIMSHTMNYDRPTDTDLHVRMTVARRDPSIPIDDILIEAALEDLLWKIRQTATATELYGTVYGAASTFVATDLEISDDGAAWTDESLTPDYDERFSISSANITITEV